MAEFRSLIFVLAAILQCVILQGLLIQNVTVGSGQDRGLVIVTLSNGLTGSVCLLNPMRVGQAVCSHLLDRTVPVAQASMFTGTTTQPVVVALNGCPDYNPVQTSRIDLNNDCVVVTSPSAIPSFCESQRLQVVCEHVELRNGLAAKPSEGLVVVGLSGRQGTVCATGTGINEAAAICRSLGFNPQRSYPVIGRYKPDMNNTDEKNVAIQGLSCKLGDRLINCSWESVTNCFDTRNQLSVACSNDPPTPRPQPSPSLLCNRQEAQICFKNETIDSPSELQLKYNVTADSNCTVLTRTNSTHLCLDVKDYQTCAAKWDDSHPGHSIYRLLVYFFGRRDHNGNLINPAQYFHLYCRLAKESLATGRSIAPEFTIPPTEIDGHAGANTAVEVYRDLVNGEFKNPILGSVDVGTIIYAGVFIQYPAPSGSLLVTNNCWATNGLQSAALVTNKCANTTDVSLISVNDTAMAVRFRAFLFNGSTSAIMQLYCTTTVCRVNDPSDQCSRQCSSLFSGTISTDATGSTAKPAWLSVRQPTSSASALLSQPAYLSVLLLASLNALLM